MDWMKDRKRLQEIIEKYKYVFLIISIGIFLMVLPTEKKTKPENTASVETAVREPVEEQLEKILAQIRGVGKVQVMLTEQTGPETIYQIDEDRTEGADNLIVKKETVITSGGGIQTGLVRTVTPATYLGAVVVCQGAGSPAVRLSVANAVSAVTGISMDRISVLEMK